MFKVKCPGCNTNTVKSLNLASTGRSLSYTSSYSSSMYTINYCSIHYLLLGQNVTNVFKVSGPRHIPDDYCNNVKL